MYHLLRKSAKYTQNNPKVLFACFIDLRKAFDKVRHNGLLYKLRKNGISDLFYNILKNMYQKTESCVKTDRSNVTDSFSSNICVRQGVTLKPNLFKQFINDLPEIFDQTCNPVTLNSLKLNCLLYTDDIVLLSETAEGLQNSLDKVSQYCKKWGMEINTDKTKSLVFNSTGRLFPVTLMIDNQLIEKVKHYRYLGVMINASGSFSDD